MRKPVTAKQLGDDYQAYQFWMLAADMLRPTAKIAEVGYEVGGYKAFDDVAVKYSEPRIHAHGIDIDTDYFQIKFSVNYAKAITAEALVDPEFVGAESVSFLERLRDAVHNIPSGLSHRFILITSRPLDPRDALSSILNTSDGSINCDVLFQGATERSRMGKVRALWSSKLGLIDESDLVPILNRLKISIWPENLQDIIGHLNARLDAVGLQPWPESHRSNPYPPLIRKLCSEGKQWFTADCIRLAASHDGLLNASRQLPPQGVRLGIRTFMRWAEGMEDETNAMLCLCESFIDRHIRSPELWVSTIIPSVSQFLKDNVRPGGNYVLDLQSLTSVAYLSGHLLDPKLNLNVAIAQARGSSPWEVDSSQISKVDDRWKEQFSLGGESGDLIVGVGITRSVSDDVEAYIRTAQFEIQTFLNLELQGGPSQWAIADATDAYGLAQHAVNRLIKLRKERNIIGPTHLFIAGPNIFSFFFGQLARPLGEIRLYEYNFGSGKTGAYTPSMNINHKLSL